jgi:hypothetical protein
VFADGQPGVHQRPYDVELQLGQLRGLLVEPRQAGNIGQRRATPERRGSPQHGHPLGGLGLLGLAKQTAHHLHVGGLARVLPRFVRDPDVEQVAGRPGHDGGPGAEHGPQMGNVALQRVHRGSRRVVSPHDVDEPIGAHDVSRLQRQRGEDCPATHTADRLGRAGDGYVDRAEKPDPHLPSTCDRVR